ncbi:MAG: type II toxin-antitoxin system VapC family toxin [Rhodoglobus sp.]
MIGVDTNVIVRFVVKDDAEQSEAAARFFAERSQTDPAFITIVTLVETVWTLKRSYWLQPDAVTRFVRGLLGSGDVVLQAPDVVRRALTEAEEAHTDFADAVIALLAIDADCDHTVTFDKRATELPGMLLLT